MIWLANNWRNMIWFALVLCVMQLAYSARDYRDRADKAESDLKSAKETIIDMQTRQRDVAALDAKYTKELIDAKAENDALQRRLDHGGRVLVKGNCTTSSTATNTSSSLDDATTVELSSTAGRNVYGIRSGIQRDQAALKGLQEYINTQCLK